ncbi:MAG: lysoplasmalogenase [Rhizobiaceae bacterium]|nr:lysoplasmalogenase [Rhizobiaceae bacterium]MCV0407603.1 lysoplasmalogenase [Rhizobiaceae bacterium]
MMPFTGGIEGTANATLLFSVAAAVIYLAMLRRPPSWRRTLAKTGSILLLAWLAYAEAGPPLLVAALVLSAAGDACLAQEGEKPFLAGLGAFLAAHLAYAALFWSAGDVARFGAEPWRILLALAMIGFSAAMFRLLRPLLRADMQAPVAAYMVAILAMGVAAASLPAPLVILGAVAFMASDAILAVERFMLPSASPHRAWTGAGVWILYWIAQALITLGVLLT